MNIQDPKSPAVITAAIYAIVKVTLYLIGVIWPSAAPHAQFVADTLVPIVIIFAVYYVSRPSSQPAMSTRSLAPDMPQPEPSKLKKLLWTLVSPFAYLIGAIFGLIIFFTQQPGPNGIFWSGNAATEPKQSRD